MILSSAIARQHLHISLPRWSLKFTYNILIILTAIRSDDSCSVLTLSPEVVTWSIFFFFPIYPVLWRQTIKKAIILDGSLYWSAYKTGLRIHLPSTPLLLKGAKSFTSNGGGVSRHCAELFRHSVAIRKVTVMIGSSACVASNHEMSVSQNCHCHCNSGS